MKVIAAIILGMGIGLAIGWTASALASPTQQVSNEELIADLDARVQALEYLRRTENHAVSAVSLKVWERASSCEIDSIRFHCYLTDPVLSAFNGLDVSGNYRNFLALSAFSYGRWSASPNEDGDRWTVSVIIPVQNQDDTTTDYGPVRWTVWESNGYIEAAQ